MNGSGVGQMLSKRTSGGTAVYVAIEGFEGVLDGKRGSFTLLHNGFMSADEQSLDATVVQVSGTDELENISGSMQIDQADGTHQYVFSYHIK
ncbi:MAG: hypothetical protein ACJAQ6_000279 [Arenicella sp.]